MGHLVRETPWCVIDLDTTEGRIFLQQRWRYTWSLRPPLADWTLAEKRRFHRQADRSIWAAWSNRVRLNVRGRSAFARQFNTSGVTINLDVRWVTADEHWNVTVTKVPVGAFVRSHVNWRTHTIALDTNDFQVREHCPRPRARAACTRQVPLAHEFGHAAGNTAALGRGDEYRASSTHTADRSSIMNVGSQLRNRHFTTIIEQLNQMLPATTFTVRNV